MHGMTLVSFELFRKNLGNLREFFGQMVHRPPPPPGKKLPVRLCLTKMISERDIAGEWTFNTSMSSRSSSGNFTDVEPRVLSLLSAS